MTLQQKKINARLFLSGKRTVTETPSGARYTFFSAGSDPVPGNRLFNDLYMVEEEVLEGGASSEMVAGENTLLLLLPVNGAVGIHQQSTQETLVAAGQLYFIPLKTGESVQVYNPFRDGAVNFLQFRFRTGTVASVEAVTASFDVNKYPGCMMRVSPACLDTCRLPFIFSIGKFGGRQETVYHLFNPGAVVLAIVLAGAFELQGCLLHPGDALAIGGVPALEAEALSNDAVLLMLELRGISASV